MQSDAKPAHDSLSDRSSRSPISVAILAALAFMPIVVAVGFLSDRSGPALSVPGDIDTLALRGVLDGTAGPRSDPAGRADY